MRRRAVVGQLVTALTLAAVVWTSMGWPSAGIAAPPGCPAGNFPDLSRTAGAGAGYARPQVTASCTGASLTVTSNGMVSYPFVPTTPNALKEQQWTWTIPVTPGRAATTTSIRNRLGTLGFTVTGLPIYGPTEGPVPAAQAYGDPVFNGILDTCGGHTGPASEYHNHALNSVDQACNLQQRRVLGYALDGFPIYNATGCLTASCSRTAAFTSGYVRIGDPTSNVWNAYAYRPSGSARQLDACNGRMEPDGTYGYHATSTFPYIIGCFRGTPVAQQGRAGGPMPPMQQGPPRA